MKQLKGWKLYAVMVFFWLPVMVAMVWLRGHRGSHPLATQDIAIIAVVAAAGLLLWTFADRSK